MPDEIGRAAVWLLIKLHGIGRSTIRAALRNVEEPSEIFRLGSQELLLAGFDERQARTVMRNRGALPGAAEELDALSRRGIRLLLQDEPDYPARLKRIPDPPPYLFVRGALPPDDVPSVAVIGSRNATTYGLRMAEFFSAEFARMGFSVVSGMAAGIDGAAQRAALSSGGKSYAVLGCGVNICYPNENYDIFSLMENGSGGIISEYPPGSAPVKGHFPERNRIISGLSDCVAVIEARGLSSGSQITVGYALEQGKDVFAVPGRVTDPLSRGCNGLIQNGAFLLNSPGEVAEALGLKREGRLLPVKRRSPALKGNERLVYETMGTDPCFAETLIMKTGLPAGEIMSILLNFELDGLVKQLSGNYFVRS